MTSYCGLPTSETLRRLNAECRVAWRAPTLARCALEDGPESADGARERGIFRRIRNHRVLQEREQGFFFFFFFGGGEPRYRAVLHRRRHSRGASRATTKALQHHRHAGKTLAETFFASDHRFLLKAKSLPLLLLLARVDSFLLKKKKSLTESISTLKGDKGQNSLCGVLYLYTSLTEDPRDTLEEGFQILLIVSERALEELCQML